MSPFPGIDWIDNVPTDQEARTQDLHRRGGDVYFIIHHSVTTRVQDTIATFKSDREVSANFAIGPTVAGGNDIKVVLTVPEARRAWTSASPLDDRALTTEVCDQSLGGNYPISGNAKEILARIASYMHVEYGMPLDRVHVLTHQEVYARGYGSYPTACAGPDMQASMDWIVARAKELLVPSVMNAIQEGEMKVAYSVAGAGPGGRPQDGRVLIVGPFGVVQNTNQGQIDSMKVTFGFAELNDIQLRDLQAGVVAYANNARQFLLDGLTKAVAK